MAAWLLPFLLLLLAGASHTTMAGRRLAQAEDTPTSTPDVELLANRV